SPPIDPADSFLPLVARAPLVFEELRGAPQEAPRFRAWSAASAVFFLPTSLVLAPPTRDGGSAAHPAGRGAPPPRFARPSPASASLLHLEFLGANRAAALRGGTLLPSKVNHFRGRDATAWQVNAPTYADLVYHEIYPGVDLTYAGRDGQLKSTYTVAPG